MSGKRRGRGAVLHTRIVRDPKSPYWYAEFEVDGERFHKSTRQRDEAAAQTVANGWYNEAVAAAGRRRKTGIEPMRLWEAASAWWEHVKFGDESDLGPFSNDPQFVDRPINRLVRVIGRDKYVHDVWNPDLQKLIDERRKDVKRSGVDDDGDPLFKPIAVRTINRTTTRLLRRVLFFVRDNHGQGLHDPPITFGKFLKGQMKEKKRPPRVITPREAVKLKQTERPDLTPLREFAVLTTLRLEECLITWPQVDFATRKIRLVQKGGEWREIDITPAIERILRPLKGHHETHVFTWKASRTRKCPKTGQKFEKGKRYPWTYWGVSSARRRDWPKAGIKANFHDLRRTGAEYMRAAGVPIDVYSKQLGHSDIKTTQIYMGDLSPEQLAGSAIQRDAWLEAVNAKIEAELAEEAAARSDPTKNPTTGRGAKRKQLKLR
jgi:integrase